MFFFKLLKCCKGDTAADLDCLPPARAIELQKPSTKKVNSFLPTSTRPIPELDVSPSSSTSVAMFNFEAVISVPPRNNSFTEQGNFEDVDLSSPTIFSSPPSRARKTLSSPFEDHYEVGYSLAVDDTFSSDDNESSSASSSYSTEPSVLFEQADRTSSFSTCPSPFGDEHEVEQDIEYAPTTVSPNNEYAQRAMEYQRVCLLFGPGSVECQASAQRPAESRSYQDFGRENGPEPSVLSILCLLTPSQVALSNQNPKSNRHTLERSYDTQKEFMVNGYSVCLSSLQYDVVTTMRILVTIPVSPVVLFRVV
ncbi:hypothetical protein KCU65_g391, partial [Aureobasidium melanogenum]